MPVPSAPSGGGFMYSSPTDVYLSWIEPEYDGGAPVTTYLLSLTPDGQPTIEHSIEFPVQCYVLHGLVHGIDVQATVKASNDGGQTYGPEFVFPLIVPLAAPTVPPASAEAAPLEPGTASITWTPPEVAAEGNAYYLVMSKSSNPSDPSVGLGTANMEQVSCILTGLNPESEYSFTVEVVNQVGRSPVVTTNTIIFPPPPPPVEESAVEPAPETIVEQIEPIDTTQFDALPMAPPITEEEALPEGYTEAPAEEAPAEEAPAEEAAPEAPQPTE